MDPIVEKTFVQAKDALGRQSGFKGEGNVLIGGAGGFHKLDALAFKHASSVNRRPDGWRMAEGIIFDFRIEDDVFGKELAAVRFDLTIAKRVEAASCNI